MRSTESKRPPKLTPEDVRKIDEWMQPKPEAPHRHRVRISIICRRLRVSSMTVYDAHKRVNAYAEFTTAKDP